MTTERDLLDALWARMVAPQGMGPPRYVLAEHVRHDPTYGHSIADAISIDTWGSGHYRIEGYEVKCTRSDWRRELVPGLHHDPDAGHTIEVPHVKSLPWRQHCSRWWIVTPPAVVRDDLPPGWGLIELHGTRLRTRTRAANTPHTVPLAPRQIAGLMRAVSQTAAHHTRTTYETRLAEAHATTPCIWHSPPCADCPEPASTPPT